MTGDPHPWATDLVELHDEVWARLVRGVGDRRAPARHPTLATVTPAGKPSARTVVLRHADARFRRLEVHTDLHSAKIPALRTTPFAALHVWDSSAHLQIRLEAEVAVLTGADVASRWSRVPDTARSGYGGAPRPGEPISDGLGYTRQPDPASFAVLQLSIVSMDILHLGRNHRRARFDRERSWQGQWLAP